MARILRQTTVIRDGMHNAFTDLVFWKGVYWVSYRKGTNHATMDGEAVVACSIDRTRFREVAHVRVPGDNRDPKLVVDGDRLALVFPSWVYEYKGTALQQYVAFSNDGFNWSTPQKILSLGKWLWRIRRHGDTWYGLIEGIEEDRPGTGRGHYLEIVTSTDLVEWTHHCLVGTPEMNLNESDICWQPDGEAWIVSRAAGKPGHSYFASAAPPYLEWETSSLGVTIHAPAILEHEGAWYVTGRRFPDGEGDDTYPFLGRSSVGVWRLERGKVVPVLRIPATGDCSYCGFIKDPDGRICLTYYSQHAYHMGVVAPPFRLEPDEPHDKGQLLTPNDVYFSELQLP